MNWLKHIRLFTAMMAALVALTVVSCSDDSSPEAPLDSPDIYLTLRVGVAEPVAGSRSRAEGDTYFQLPDRLCEKLLSLRVIIVDNNNKVEANRKVTLDANGAIVSDNLTFKVKAGQKTVLLYGNEYVMPQNVRTMIEKAVTGQVIDMEAVNNATLSQTSGQFPYDWERKQEALSGKYAVPMTEKWNIEVKAIDSDGPADPNNPVKPNYYQTADLFITRAVTKFSFTVNCADNLPEGILPSLAHHEITAFRIDRIGKQQYLMPRALYSPAKGQPAADGKNGRLITFFEVPDDYGAPEPAPFTFTPATPCDVNKLIPAAAGKPGDPYVYSPMIYLPETPGPNFRCFLTVRNKLTGAEEELPVSAELPNLPSLPRNTHVMVNILLTAGEIKCLVDVVPYTSVSLNPTFGFDELLPRPVKPGEIPPWLEIGPDEEDVDDPDNPA